MNIGEVAICLLGFFATADTHVSAVAQMDAVNQSALAEMISSTHLGEQAKALAAINRLKKDDVDPQLRVALFDALQRETRAHVARHNAGRAGQSLPQLEDPLFVGALVRSVVRLGDPRSIPVLAPTTAFGFEAVHALAAFGEAAASEVLKVVEDRNGMYYAVEGGLVTLRFMIEAPKAGALSAKTLQRVRNVVRDRLTTPAAEAEFVVLWAAIDLAAVLRDADLLGIVKSLAEDPTAIKKRGITHAEVTKRTRQRAIDALAGVPPKPRPPVVAVKGKTP